MKHVFYWSKTALVSPKTPKLNMFSCLVVAADSTSRIGFGSDASKRVCSGSRSPSLHQRPFLPFILGAPPPGSLFPCSNPWLLRRISPPSLSPPIRYICSFACENCIRSPSFITHLNAERRAFPVEEVSGHRFVPAVSYSPRLLKA